MHADCFRVIPVETCTILSERTRSVCAAWKGLVNQMVSTIERRSPLHGRDEVVVAQLGCVRSIARQIASKLPAHIELDDLVQAGVLGLIAAAEKFDDTRNTTFIQYARHRVRGAILDYLRKEDWLSRDSRRRQKRIDAVKGEIAAETCSEPSTEAVSARLGLSLSEFHRFARDVNSGVITLLRQPGFGNDDKVEREPSARWTDRPDAMSARSESRSLLASIVARLPERCRVMLTMMYDLDMTMKQVGFALNVNETRIFQLHKKALKQLTQALNRRGVYSCRDFLTESM